MTDIKETYSRRDKYELEDHESRNEDAEGSVLGLVPEDLHSEESSEAAEARGKQKQGLFGDPPAAFFGL